MSGFLHEIFWGGGFMPHGHCYLWNPGLVRLHVISDALIALSYTSIPFTLAHFIRKRKDLPFSWIFLCFGTFIIACGATHYMEIWTLWVPSYWISGIVKAITAIASVGTAYLLVRLMPQALALPSQGQMVAVEDRFRRLLEAAPDAMVIVDKNGIILLVNEQTERLFGYPRAEMLGKPVELLVPARFREKHPGHREGYSHEPRVRPMGAGLDLSALRKDGSEFPVEISLSPIATDEGIWTTAAIRDISDRKQTEAALKKYAEQLESSNRELEDFAHAASHDLQEPLRKVASYCGLLATRYKGKLGEDADEYIRLAVNGAGRMRALIEGLLNYSRVRTKDTPFQQVNMESALKLALENLSEAISESRGTVVSEPLPSIHGDELQMVQLFQNLIGNALKFKSSRPPEVKISAKREGAQWRFLVADNGIGIEPQYIGKLFTIFQRLHTQQQYPGTGIGLALCKKIVERHGGQIGIESQPGKGSTFWFLLRAEMDSDN